MVTQSLYFVIDYLYVFFGLLFASRAVIWVGSERKREIIALITMKETGEPAVGIDRAPTRWSLPFIRTRTPDRSL